MSDYDAQWDEAVATAMKNIEANELLAAQVREAIQKREEWENANGTDQEKRVRFFSILPPEEKRKMEDENEAFDREIRHEMERLTEGMGPKKKAPNKKRNYM